MVSFNNLQGGTKRVYSVRGGDGGNGTGLGLNAGASLYDYSIGETYVLKPISDTTQPTGNEQITVTLPSSLQTDWKVAGLGTWELKNGSTPVDAMPVQAVSMDGQTAIRVCFKTTDSVPQTVNAGTISIILVKR